MGRHKIPIQKIEKKEARQISFSKRRKGLFKKASDLWYLGRHRIAIVAFSEVGNAFSFGHPSAEAIADHFLNGTLPTQQEELPAAANEVAQVHDDESSSGSDDDDDEDEEEEEDEEGEDHYKGESSGGSMWWNRPVDVEKMGLGELVKLRRAMSELRGNLVARANTILEQRPLSLGSLYCD